MSETNRNYKNKAFLASNCTSLSCSTSRGDYTFGTAIGGHTVQQPCERIAEGRPFGFAYLLCRESGEWAATVNTSQCAYTSAVTDTLHKFAAMNMTFTPRTLMESARQFLNFTADPAVFQDEMDLVYFSHAVENYLPYLVSEHMIPVITVQYCMSKKAEG